MKRWYFNSYGVEYGPITDSDLQDLIADGTVTRETSVWMEGIPEWIPAGTVSRLFETPSPTEDEQKAGSELAPSSSTKNQNRPIDTHMMKAVLCTLFCCMPFGIVAIVNASNASSALAGGDVKMARIYASKSSDWADTSIIVAIVMICISFIYELSK